MEMSITEVYKLLYRIRLRPDHTGYTATAYAVWLCVEDPKRLQLVTKRLYPEVAEHYETTWQAVEGSIRRAIGEVWEEDRKRLEEVAGRALARKPRPAEFLGILTVSLLEGRSG